jgi:hypothetical protein
MDWLAPMTPQSMSGLASSVVKSQIDPLVKEISDSIARRSAEGSQKISAFNDRWFQALGPMRDSISGAYDKAIQSESAITGGISSFLEGQGAAAQADVSSQLAAAGAPQEALDVHGGQLGALGHGIAGQAVGRGSLEMQMLNSDRLAEDVFQGRLPGIVRQFGTEKISDFQGGLNSMLQDSLGDINSQVPGLVSGVYQGLMKNEVEKAIAREGFRTDRQRITAAANQPPGFDSGFSNFTGYAYDENGNLITDANGNPIPKYESPSSTTAKSNNKNKQQTIQQATAMTVKLLNRTNPVSGLPGSPVKNRDAYLQVYAYVRGRHPGATEAEIWRMTQSALVAGGYAKAADYTNVQAAVRGGVAARPGQNAGQPSFNAGGKPKVKPKPKAKATTDSAATSRIPTEQAQKKAQERLKAAQEAAAWEIGNVAKYNGKRSAAKKAAMAALRKSGLSPKQIENIVEKELTKKYGGFFYPPGTFGG